MHLLDDLVKINTLSSLTSTPPRTTAEADFEFQYSDPSKSPALSTTSTFEGGDSPNLPPLPEPTINGHTLNILRTPPPGPPSEPRTDTSAFYTASWGSPYPQNLESSDETRSVYRSAYSEASEDWDDLPIRHLELHTPFLRPPPPFTRSQTESDFVSHDGLISAAVLANRARRPAHRLTEDWIRQHTGGESTESNNWLSDDPGGSKNSSLSGSISGDAADQLDLESDPRTPTIQRHSQSSQQSRWHFSGHRRQGTAETLTQADIISSTQGELSNMAMQNENGSERGNGNGNGTPVEEKPLPPPPMMAPWASKVLPLPASSSPVSMRPRKKVPWKGKNIFVLLPLDQERGKRDGPPKPMTQKDVAAMLKDWEQLGYDTTGFNLGTDNEDGEGGPGQSRIDWPRDSDMEIERAQRAFHVSIPDKRDWDSYVEEVKEARLRNLGVSLGGDDPVPIVSPAISNISRRTSLLSPPLPPSSAASSHLARNSNLPFSPAIMAGNGRSTSQSSNQASIPSPASMHAHLHGKLGMRHNSVSFSPNGDHPYGSPFQYPQSHSPGVWSPQQMHYQHGHRGASPSMHDLRSMMPPASPLSQDGYFPQPDVLSQRQMLQNQSITTGARSSPRLPEVRESEDELLHEGPSKSPSKTPEAAQAAQAIKHNASASLQREIDDAEYHLEEQFQRQLDGDDYSPHSDHENMDKHFENKPASNVGITSTIAGSVEPSRFPTEDSEDGPVLHHPQPHSRGHSLSQQPFQDSEDTSSGESKDRLRGARGVGKYDLSDVETNPSNSGTPNLQNGVPLLGHDRDMSVGNNPWLDAESTQSAVTRPAHRSKPSMSTLNVAAKPFKFDPSSSFQPNQFAFSTGNNFQPAPASNFAPLAHNGLASGGFGHYSNHSVKNSFSKVNPAAPPFAPTMQAFTLGQSDFSFTGPSFRPDAPAFTPFTSNNLANSMSDVSGNEAPKDSIFGNIDLNALDVSKHGKKSKAIPIIRPDSGHTDGETMEGKDGRITQAEGRIKRMRGENGDGDSVPLFAEPSMPLQDISQTQSIPMEAAPAQGGKENSVTLGEMSDEMSSDELNADSENEDGEFAPFEFHQQKQAEDFNAARPFTSRRQGSGLSGYDMQDSEDVDATESKHELHSKTSSGGSGSHFGHRKTPSSLSATAKPFDFRPTGNAPFTFGGFNVPKLVPDAPNHTGGLSSSRFASSPPPLPLAPATESHILQPEERHEFQNALPQPQSPPQYEDEVAQSSELEEGEIREPTFEEIDAVMREMNQNEPSPGPHGDHTPRWHQPSPTRHIQVPIPMSSPIRLQPHDITRSDAPSPSPRRYNTLAGGNYTSRSYSNEQDDPFMDPHPAMALGSPVHRLNTGNSLPISDWDDVLSEGEEIKLQERVGFFDNHVNDIVGGLLAERLDPMEKALEDIQISLQTFSRSARAPSSRRERRSMSGVLSDADDEDDEDPRRSMSPRRNTKLDKIRTIVIDALNTHQSRPQTAITPSATSTLPDSRNILQALEEMKEQFGQSMRLDLRAEDLRNIVEEAVERRLPASPKEEDSATLKLMEADAKITAFEKESQAKFAALEAKSQARISELEEKLHRADDWVEEEIRKRRSAEDSKAMTERLMSSTLEEESRLRQLVGETSTKVENEASDRRKAEDRLAEVQRLLRIASEEEDRLRDVMLEKDAKMREIAGERDQTVRSVEESRGKTTMRIALLEAAQENSRKTEADLTATIHMAESELRESRSLAHRWQLEAESAMEAAKRHSDDAEQANETNRELRRTIETLKNQMEESIRVRESMRSKLMDLQEDMATAAHNISQEHSHRAKKEQELLARQEVLDAKLQAEARTRERLEMEIERLESGERQGIRAVNECKRLEVLVGELRTENHIAQKDLLKYKRELEEARESYQGELQRTKKYMQVQVDTANNQVNVIRDDYDNQILSLRNQIDLIKLDAETTKEQHDMLLEEAQSSKQRMSDELRRKHQDEVEDLQTQHDRQLNNTNEDAQRAEQLLLERLDLSKAKTDHLQDRIIHLEHKLEIAKDAAQAAAGAAKAARSAGVSLPSPALPRSGQHITELPEKVSPQALRESIMVLQEQLQDREIKNEELEQQLSNVDPDAATKISKRDDEIMWLRELLEVRKSDLQDIVNTLSHGTYDPDSVRDAAIRLSANLQMEEQERERAMNGGSAINLPNIAASIAASPRVAQVANAVGPLAAAWGNWTRKSKEQSAPASTSRAAMESGNSTPSKAGSTSGFLSGLMTPPASNTRFTNTPPGAPAPVPVRREPTAFVRDNALSAFNATGQRFTAAHLSSRPGISTPRRADKVPMRREAPNTPPMMRSSSYDSDAVPHGDDTNGGPSLGMSLGEELGDFGSDAGFYDDDESTIDEMAGIYSGGFGR